MVVYFLVKKFPARNISGFAERVSLKYTLWVNGSEIRIGIFQLDD